MTCRESSLIHTGLLWKYKSSVDKIALLDEFVVGSVILDVGAGSGWYSQILHDRGLTVTSMDVTPEPKMSSAFVGSHVLGDAALLPFKEKAFDTVLVFDVMEHVAGEHALIMELRRVTRSRIIVSVPSDDDAFLYSYGLSLAHHVDKSHMREYSTRALALALESAGFRVIAMRPSTAPQMPLNTIESHSIARRGGKCCSS